MQLGCKGPYTFSTPLHALQSLVRMTVPVHLPGMELEIDRSP